MRHDASRVARRSIAWLVIVALLASSCATKPFKPEADELALWAQAENEEDRLQKKLKPYDDPLLEEYLASIVTS
jgi:hypothetical protein